MNCWVAFLSGFLFWPTMACFLFTVYVAVRSYRAVRHLGNHHYYDKTLHRWVPKSVHRHIEHPGGHA